MRRSRYGVVPLLAVVALTLGAVTASATPAEGVAAPVASPAVPAAAKPVSGYQQVQSELLTDVAESQSYGDVTCPRGTKVVSGGAVITREGLQENINSSLPLDDGRTWRVSVSNTLPVDGTFTVHAVCASQVRGYAVVVSDPVDNPPGEGTSITVDCPGDTVPFGGGAYQLSTSPEVTLNSSFPLGHGWRADVSNGSEDGNTGYAYAVCGIAPTGYQQVAANRFIPPRSRVDISAGCRGQRIALGGGGSVTVAGPSAGLISTAPLVQTRWQSTGRNVTPRRVQLTTYAVCARAAV